MGTIKGIVWTTFVAGTCFYLGYKANDIIKDNGYLTQKGNEYILEVDKTILEKIDEGKDKLYDVVGDLSDKVKSMYNKD